MSQVPNLAYTEIIAALQRDGWIAPAWEPHPTPKALPRGSIEINGSRSQTSQAFHTSLHFKAGSYQYRPIFRAVIDCDELLTGIAESPPSAQPAPQAAITQLNQMRKTAVSL